jgi:hypothetical protein
VPKVLIASICEQIPGSDPSAPATAFYAKYCRGFGTLCKVRNLRVTFAVPSIDMMLNIRERRFTDAPRV